MTTISQYGYQTRLPYIRTDATYFPPKFPKKYAASPVPDEEMQRSSHLFIRLFANARDYGPRCHLVDRRLSSGSRPSSTSRFALNMLKDRLIHRAVQARLGGVHQSVIEYGGQIVYPPAQTENVPIERYGRQQDEEGAALEDDLALCWIHRHVIGDRLLTHLEHQAQLGPAADHDVALKRRGQREASAPIPGRAAESWLSTQSVRLRRVALNHLDRFDLSSCRLPLTVTGQTGRRGTSALLRAMFDTHGKGACYKKIRLTGDMASHTVAAHVDDQAGVRFFDAHFGEFHFPDKACFGQWFAQAFWQDTMYGKEMGLGQAFSVVNYEVQSK